MPFSKTRQRGLRRKCRNMVRRIREETSVFPSPHDGTDNWHLHLPVARTFIDSPKTPSEVKRLCLQTLLNRASHLAAIAPQDEEDIRVVVAANPAELRMSQIIVFFGPAYFNKFFHRDTEAQRWSEIKGKSLVREWYLILPEGFSERAYHEELRDEDGTRTSTFYFLGQLT